MKRTLLVLLVILILGSLTGCLGSFDIFFTTNIPRGTFDGNVYKNGHLGFEFVKPDSWVYYTDEEIVQLLQLNVDDLSEKNFNKALKYGSGAYDMMAVGTLAETEIYMGYEKLKSVTTVERYIDGLKQHLLETPGITVSFFGENEEVKLGDGEFTKFSCSVIEGGRKWEQSYYLCITDGYMAYVVITVPTGHSIADIEARFR